MSIEMIISIVLCGFGGGVCSWLLESQKTFWERYYALQRQERERRYELGALLDTNAYWLERYYDGEDLEPEVPMEPQFFFAMPEMEPEPAPAPMEPRNLTRWEADDWGLPWEPEGPTEADIERVRRQERQRALDNYNRAAPPRRWW